MNDRRRRVCRVWILASLLLLPSCARPPATASAQTSRTYVRSTEPGTSHPAFWWYDRVRIKEAHEKATGAGRTVAIIDTGVLTPHEDLPAPSAGSAATCGDRADITDRNGHGTQLAGIVVGQGRGHATRGIAPLANLIAVKIDCGVVTTAALQAGLDRAIAQKPDVVLLALGGYPYPPAPKPTEPDALTAFLKQRISDNPAIVFVVASVWDGDVYKLPDWTTPDNVIVVAGTALGADMTEVPYGIKRGHIWAPGKDVDTASIDYAPNSTLHDRFSMQGTSPAAAIVAGCALLVKDKNSRAGVAAFGGKDVKDALVKGADQDSHLGPSGAGRLNCDKAMP